MSDDEITMICAEKFMGWRYIRHKRAFTAQKGAWVEPNGEAHGVLNKDFLTDVFNPLYNEDHNALVLHKMAEVYSKVQLQYWRGQGLWWFTWSHGDDEEALNNKDRKRAICLAAVKATENVAT